MFVRMIDVIIFCYFPLLKQRGYRMLDVILYTHLTSCNRLIYQAA